MLTANVCPPLKLEIQETCECPTSTEADAELHSYRPGARALSGAQLSRPGPVRCQEIVYERDAE